MNTYSSYDDEQLILLLKNGDETAFNEIYERYWELLLGMAFNRLKQLHEAEDVVHDVFASLWKTRSSREISSLRAYLAVSLKYNILRVAYRKKLFAAFVSGNDPDNLTYTIRPVEDREIMSNIQDEMEKLPEKCKIIFQMSRLDGLSNTEIAETLNITNKTVENQINKAQGRLRSSLKNLSIFLAALLFF